MFSIRKILLTAVLILSAPVMANAADLVSQIQKKYGNIKTLQTSFEQRLTHKESGSIEDKNGTLQFKKPLLVRWDVASPTAELLVVSKDFIWNVFDAENVAYKYPLSVAQENQSIVQVITGQAKLNQDFSVKELGMENGLAKLELLPNEPTQSMVEAFLWVDPKTFLIHKVLIIDFYANTNEITFKNHKLDENIKDSQFVFKLPSDMDLEDHTTDSDVQLLR